MPNHVNPTHQVNPTHSDVGHTRNPEAKRPQGGVFQFKKLSWGAVLAGVLVALVSMLLLNLLGIGIGLATINPMSEQTPMSGLGTGALIWWIVSNLISIFAGAYVAARMAGIPNKGVSMFHGLLSWCAFTLISFWLLTTAVGGIISGVGSVVSQTLSSVSSGVKSIIQDGGSSGQSGNQSQNQASLNLQGLTGDINQVIRAASQSDVIPDSVAQVARQTVNNIQTALAKDVDLTNQDIRIMVQQLLQRTNFLQQDLQKQEVVTIVSNQTSLSDETVSEVADVIVTNFEQAAQELKEFKQQAAQEAEKVAQDTADATASAAIWGFVALLIGGGASVAGGRTGNPSQDLVRNERW